jgi:Na+-transporting methylmalonyl-CoA/oxaloacetate decarboxylase gamma subunit
MPDKRQTGLGDGMVLPIAVVFHGVVAVLIILVILAIIIAGVYTLLRATGRGVKKVADAASHNDRSH